MDGQRQKANGGRRRRRRSKSEPKPQAAPVLIAARRPDSPLLAKGSSRSIAASAQPKKLNEESPKSAPQARPPAATADKPRRVARIAEARTVVMDEHDSRRHRLLERLATCEGRSAITRVADELLEEGIPEEQQYQLQLLEHVDEQCAKNALGVLARLFENQEPIKRPILDRRLRRLEDEADELDVREQAGELRRFLRSTYPMKPAQAS
jgi:hypothetical protein